jgi:hypothetical protein
MWAIGGEIMNKTGHSAVIVDGQMKHRGVRYSSAFFLHSQPFRPGVDVFRMTVLPSPSRSVRGTSVGFAGQGYSLSGHMATCMHTAFVQLTSDGTTVINPGVSAVGVEHMTKGCLSQHVLDAPFQVSLRLTVALVPQVRFGPADAQWHNFDPSGAALKAGVAFYPRVSMMSDGNSIAETWHIGPEEDAPAAARSRGGVRSAAAAAAGPSSADCPVPKPALPPAPTKGGGSVADRVGESVSKEFVGYGIFDGVVTAFFAPSKGRGGCEEALWHVRYSDGDEEDLAEPELDSASALFLRKSRGKKRKKE